MKIHAQTTKARYYYILYGRHRVIAHVNAGHPFFFSTALTYIIIICTAATAAVERWPRTENGRRKMPRKHHNIVIFYGATPTSGFVSTVYYNN